MKRVADLEGVELALWVGRADGADFGPDCNQGEYIITGGHSGITPEVYAPHEDWAQGGPIIEKYGIAIFNGESRWAAEVRGPHIDFEWIDTTTYDEITGSAPLIAAMRAFVASKFGETVDEVEK